MRELLRSIVFCALACAAVAVFAVIVVGKGQDLREANVKVRTWRDIEITTERVLGALRDAETAQRGFLLTQNRQFLEPFAQADRDVATLTAALKSLAATEPLELDKATRVSDLAKSRVDELSEAIELGRAGNWPEAIARVTPGRGTTTMGQIRQVVLDLGADASSGIQAARAGAELATRNLAVSVILASLLSIVLLILLTVSLRRDARHIRESAERLATTVASVGDAVIATDSRGRIERMNPVAEKLTGWTLREALGEPLDRVFRIINEHTREIVESPLTKVLREGQVVGLANHTLLISKDQTEMQIEDSGAPIRGTDGAVTGVVVVFKDASERYAADRLLAASEARFRGTFENAAVGIAHVGLDGRFLRVNNAFLSIIGHDRAAIDTLTFADITHPDDLDADWRQAKALAEGTIADYTMEKRYLRADAAEIWVNLTVGIQRDPHGVPLFYISVIQDATERRKVASALRDSEARFRDIADATPVLIWLSDTTKTCIWFNSRWLNFTGRSLAQECGYGWVEGVHPKDAERCVATYETAFDRREPYHIEYRRKRFDGQWRLLEASGVPRVIDGAFVGFVGSCIDITEQRAASLALSRSEEQLRLATEAAEIGLWDVDILSDTVFWPPRVKAMFGISPAVPVSMAEYYAGLHPEDRQATSDAFEAAMDPVRRSIYDVEYRTVGKEDAVIRWVAAKGRGLFEEDRCVRVIGTAIDITQRKAAEAQLFELNDRLEQRVATALAERQVLVDIIEATDAFVQVVDSNYRFLAVNRASADEFARIFGVRPKVGDHMLDLLRERPEQLRPVKEVWARALAGEEFTVIEEFGDPLLDRRYYEMKFNSLRDRTGERIGAFQFVYDVTDRLRNQRRLAEAEEQIRQTQKMEAIGQLTGGIAHDFNNLLMVISGGLSLLQRSADPERRERLIERMRQAAERGASLSRQLLAFARRQPLKAEQINLHGQIDSMRELLDRTLRGDVQVKTELPPDLWPIHADPAEFELAVVNLCVNSRDAMPQGGLITITAANVTKPMEHQLEGEFVELRIADTGIGMAPAVLSRIFEPFYTTKEVGKGSGLGLPQVYGFAQQSGGTVKVDSILGKGTTVRLYLPRSADPPLSVAPATGLSDTALHRVLKGTILLVEDDNEVAALVTDMLVDLGFRVTRAASAQAALGTLADHRDIDLVFSDIVMPGSLNGVELAREVQRRWPELPVVLTSGYAGKSLAGLQLESIQVLSKPYEIQTLEATLRAALGK